MLGLTRRQSEALEFIRGSIAAGTSPTHEEIAHAVGLRSKSGSARLVTALVERGAIVRLPNRARAIGLPTGPGYRLTPENERLVEEYGRRTRTTGEVVINEAVWAYLGSGHD